MALDQALLAKLAAKEEIRELALLYSRAIDRKDFALLRTLYASDGFDAHGDYFQGPAEAYVAWLENALPMIRYTGHHVCNHLITVDGDVGQGEVYAVAWHVMADPKGGFIEDIQLVRYLDQYRKEDGRWRFARRDVAFDVHTARPVADIDETAPLVMEDLSYRTLTSRLFARGERG
jgi:ketosteroid isomerase-like protein